MEGILLLWTSLPDRLTQRTLDRLAATLPFTVRDRIAALRRVDDRARSAAGWRLLAVTLPAMAPNVTLDAVEISDFGRPRLPAPFDFNIAHSGNVALCAVASGIRVGVDVERVRPVRLDRFRRAFPADEWAALLSEPDPARAFFRQWVGRECILKADGRGFAASDDLSLTGRLGHLDGRDWHCTPVEIADGYVAALAADRRGADVQVRYLPI